MRALFSYIFIMCAAYILYIIQKKSFYIQVMYNNENESRF